MAICKIIVGKLVREIPPSSPMWDTMLSSQAGRTDTERTPTFIFQLISLLLVLIGEGLARTLIGVLLPTCLINVYYFSSVLKLKHVEIVKSN